MPSRSPPSERSSSPNWKRARRSQEFLLLASRVLAEAADYRQAVNRLAQIAVPILADLCLIDLRDEDGQNPADGGLARRSVEASAHRGAADHIPPRPRGPAPQCRRPPHRAVPVGRRHDRRVPGRHQPERTPSRHLEGPGVHLLHDGAIGGGRPSDRDGDPRLRRLRAPLHQAGPERCRGAGPPGELGRGPGTGARPGASDLPRAPAEPPARAHAPHRRLGDRHPLPSRRPTTSKWEGTGTTPSRSEAPRSPSSWATSRDTTWKRPRSWDGSVTPSRS